MIPLRRSVLVGVAVLAIAGLTSCERAKAPRRGTLTLDRSQVRRVDARWATRRAVQGVDPREPIANILLAMTFSIGPGDSIYVPDLMGHRIIVYDPDGLPVRTIGRMWIVSSGSSLGTLVKCQLPERRSCQTRLPDQLRQAERYSVTEVGRGPFMS